ncbi:SIR2 family protein [Actinomyces procaprae]|uniref:SIR2 family protein n=1 Tax=Actinomyces procaprae TaxID=2560010 RepID=UPI00109E0D45|nr:SIR2 family protein [Actinomyces procaprae]
MQFSFEQEQYLSLEYYQHRTHTTNQQPPQTALDAVSRAKHLVIYCGAGVSIDNTRVNWPNLIKESAERLKVEFSDTRIGDKKYEALHEQLTEHIERNAGNPARAASMLVDTLRSVEQYHRTQDHAQFNHRRALHNALAEVLYNRKEPVVAPLKTLVATLAVEMIFAADPDRTVTIITTNYDTHIERVLKTMVGGKLLRAGASTLPSDPNDAITIVTNDSFRRDVHSTNKAHTSSTSRLKLVYLHGRIPNGSQDEVGCDYNGRVVFSENDYFDTRESVRNMLRAHTEDADCFLILGSSLEDPPLTDWLKRNRRPATRATPSAAGEGTGKGKEDHTVRKVTTVLVQTLPYESYDKSATPDHDRDLAIELNDIRYSSMGIDYYLPTRCYSDVPHVLRDMLAAVANRCSAPITKQDLGDWGERVARCTNPKKPVGRRTLQRIQEKLYENQRPFAEEMSKFIGTVTVTESDGTVTVMNPELHIDVRLEFWARGVLTDNQRIGTDGKKTTTPENYLALIADSVSVSRDAEARRLARYSRRFPSRVAAMRACQLGQPDFMTLPMLGHEYTASRWQAFFGAAFSSLPKPSTDEATELLHSVPTHAIVAAVKLREPADVLTTRNDLKAFSGRVSERSAKILSGTLDDSEDSHFRTLHVMAKELSETIQGLLT